MPTLSQTARTTSSVTVTCSGLDGNHARTRNFVWQIYRSGTMLEEIDRSMAPGGTSQSVTFYGLSSGTTYSILCGIYDDAAHNYNELATLSCTASTSSPDPDPPQPTTVNCNVIRLLDGVWSGTYGPYTMTPGNTYNILSYMPPYDGDTYQLTRVVVDGEDLHTATFTAPDTNFNIAYWFTAIDQGNAWIWHGGEWVRATPYIWNGSNWEEARANIYDGGWKS